MSRHQLSRHAKRRLTIAAIAATALIGTSVTVGVIGIASAGQDPQAAGGQCVSKDQNGDQQSNLPQGNQQGGQNAGDQQQGDQQQGGQQQGGQNAGDQQQGDQQQGGQNAGDQQQGDQQQGGQNAGDQQQGDQQQPPAQTYGMTAPQAAHPGNPANPYGGDQQGGDQQGGDQNAGGGQQGGDQNAGGGQQGGGQQGGDQNAGGSQQGGDQNAGGDQQAQCVGPFPEDFVDINSVQANAGDPQAGANASTGVFTEDCGNNQNKHQNTDNIVIAPGKPDGAEHLHDYVGNLDTTFASTEDSLAAGGTTCGNGDQSTFFWPILRNRSADDGFDQASAKDKNNIGDPVLPAQVKIEFRGNAQSQVVAMPRFLRLFSGDAKTITNGLKNARPTYSCTGMENQVTNKYPLCPQGSTVESIHDYPGCWDGQNVDSANHRDHLAFADQQSGACPDGFKAIPQLRITLVYGDNLNDTKQGFAVDGFSTEEHDPASDHAGAINVMSDQLMQQVVDTINSGKKN
jgi:hypothetical protein